MTLLKRSKSSLDKIRVYKGCAAHDTVFLAFDCELSLVVGNVDERQEAWRAGMADSARKLDTGHPLSRSCGSKGKRAPSIESQELQPSRKEASLFCHGHDEKRKLKIQKHIKSESEK